MSQLLATSLPGIPLIQPGDDLAALTLTGLAAAGIDLTDGDVLVFASKVFSKAEGRIQRLSGVQVSPAAAVIAESCGKDPRLIELILSESRRVVRIRPNLIIVEHRLGFICANAGIDHSNAAADNDIVLLLPENPDASAADMRAALGAATGAEVAIVINDSHGRAWRVGTVGIAIGVAGLLPVSDRRGAPDLFGRPLEITELGTADEIAAGASLLQGGAGEGSPVVHLRGVPFHPGDGHLPDLMRPAALDLFR